jgi:uncharacterized repeat protein (TIGR01451 family)
VGLAALVWFAIRVIPKPSRAAYPCQRVAAPLASGFVAWSLGALAAHVALRRACRRFYEGRYWAAGAFALAALAAAAWLLPHTERPAHADYPAHPPNSPIGTARGIHPGRVTWVFDPTATNQACTNTSGDYWWYDQLNGTVNTDPARVEAMLSQTLQLLTGASSDSEAWDALFRHYNLSQGLGDVGYQPGQKIAIKVNINSGGWGNVNTATYAKIGYIGMIDTSPQLMHAMIKQLVDEAGVAPEDIAMGDPIRYFFNEFYSKLVVDYPTVQYLDWAGNNGRTWAEPSDEPVLRYSDTEDPSRFDHLPKAFVAADYMINIAALKGHDGAGITLCAKNHYGSHCRSAASHLHYTLPGPPTWYGGLTGMGHYRVLVDMMGHRDLGGKTVLFLVDGLWGAKHSIADPNRWLSPPFNNRWPSSLLASQDGVAIESVGLDFLQYEYNETNYPGETHYPFFDGTEDYIHQAADPATWPTGITYDPERDGTALGSLGTHEHWNNPQDKQYTRNLGTGDGIELITVGDLPVTIAVIATVPSAIEDDLTPGELMVSRIGDMSDEVTVSYTVSGTASSGADYQSLPASVLIPAGGSVARLAVTPFDDSLPEGDETVTLTLAAAGGYTVDPTRASATVTIVDGDPPVADVAVTKDADSITAAPGADITYTLTITNDGPSEAATVVMTDSLPAGTVFVSSVPADGGGVCDYQVGPHELTCTWPSLGAATSEVVSITVAAPLGPGEATNQADVTSATADPDLTNNSASLTTIVYDTALTGTPVSFLTASAGDDQNTVQWIDPDPGVPFQVMLRYNQAGLFINCSDPATPTDGTFLELRTGSPGTHQTFVHTGLGNDSLTYCYSAFVYRGAGAFSTPRSVRGRPFDPSGRAKWGFSIGTTSLALPGIGADRIHIVSNDNAVYAATKGATGGLWPTDWLPPIMPAPAQGRPSTAGISLGAATRVIFLASQDHTVRAVDADTGAELWASPDLTEMLVAAPAGILQAYGGAYDTILIGTRGSTVNNIFYGLNLTTGAVDWQVNQDPGTLDHIGMIVAQATVDYPNNRVYFTSYARNTTEASVWGVDLDTQAVIWSRRLGNVESAVTLRGDRVYVGNVDGEIYALDAATGADTAPFFATGDGSVKNVIFPDRSGTQIYFATNTTVWSLSDNGGSLTENWHRDDIPSPSASVTWTGWPYVYVGSSNGQLYELDATNGSNVDVIALGDPGSPAAVGAPTVDGRGGLMYAPSEAGIVYAVELP